MTNNVYNDHASAKAGHAVYARSLPASIMTTRQKHIISTISLIFLTSDFQRFVNGSLNHTMNISAIPLFTPAIFDPTHVEHGAR